MSHRKIYQLEWAAACARPKAMPVRRPRGAKGAGVGYERALARALPAGLHGQWFAFRDSAGPGYCQPDLIFDLGLRLLVLEAKYTWTVSGHTQIEQLYRPVLEFVYHKPVLAVQVCKVLVPEARLAGHVTGDLREAVDLACGGARVTLQWLGTGPLGQGARPRSALSEVAHAWSLAAL